MVNSNSNGSIVILLRPPIISSVHSFSTPVTPPLAIAYLAAVLKKNGIAVKCIDAIGEEMHHVEIKSRGRKIQGLSFEKIIERIPEHADILAVSVMFSQEWPLVNELITSIKKAHPHLTIIAGGEHVTALPEFILKNCSAIDYCGLGEGEDTIVDFVSALREGRDMSEVSGLSYRGKEGVVQTRRRPRIQDIGSIPWPAWDDLPLEVYLSSGYGNGVNFGRNMPLLATRGCPFQCTFCSNLTMYDQRYYMRSAKDVIEEIKYYIKKYRATFIEFYDLTAIVRKEWIVEFCQQYLKNNLEIPWSLPSGTRSEALDQEVLEYLYKTHCRYLVYAPESGSRETLREIKKQINLDHLVDSVKRAVKIGINTRCNLIIGFPKETLGRVLKTLLFQMKLAWIGVDDAPLYMFSPYPGSPLFDYLRDTQKIPELNEEYFDRLLAQMDLGVSQTYCERVSGKTLRFLRILGMCSFYGLSYLFRPRRIFRSIRNIFIQKKTQSVFEQRILEMFKRRREKFLSTKK